MSEPKTPQALVATYVHVDINGDILAFDERGLIAAIAARDEQIRQQERARVLEVLADFEARVEYASPGGAAAWIRAELRRV